MQNGVLPPPVSGGRLAKDNFAAWSALAGTSPAALSLKGKGDSLMAKFSKDDHVSWNSEAGRVSGRVLKVHEADFH